MEGRLNNPKFLEKASEAYVAEVRQQVAELKEKLALIEQKVAQVQALQQS